MRCILMMIFRSLSIGNKRLSWLQLYLKGMKHSQLKRKKKKDDSFIKIVLKGIYSALRITDLLYKDVPCIHGGSAKRRAYPMSCTMRYFNSGNTWWAREQTVLLWWYFVLRQTAVFFLLTSASIFAYLKGWKCFHFPYLHLFPERRRQRITQKIPQEHSQK